MNLVFTHIQNSFFSFREGLPAGAPQKILPSAKISLILNYSDYVYFACIYLLIGLG
jgi:hypothetical protein